jgi:hypothetical protein
MEKISWDYMEFKKKERTVDWYWAVIIIALALAIIALIIGDGLFSIFIILATAILLFLSNKEPRKFTVSMDKRGITVENDTYHFTNIEEFWIDVTDQNNPKIILKSKKITSPLIIIPIEDYHHLDIRDFLLQYLPENEMEEPFSHKIMDKLGF